MDDVRMVTRDDLAAGLSALAGCTLEAAGLELDAALQRLTRPPVYAGPLCEHGMEPAVCWFCSPVDPPAVGSWIAWEDSGRHGEVLARYADPSIIDVRWEPHADADYKPEGYEEFGLMWPIEHVAEVPS